MAKAPANDASVGARRSVVVAARDGPRPGNDDGTRGGSRREVRNAALRAIVLGFVCTVAVAFAAALQEPVATPEGTRAVTGWLVPVPDGWPSEPWPMARFGSRTARITWELRGDPPWISTAPAGPTVPGAPSSPPSPRVRARDFAAQWSMHCGWPLPALRCTRNRLRAIWDQGETFVPPTHGPSRSLSEGIVIQAATLGAAEGQFLLPVVPVWSGLIVDSLAWAIPFFALSSFSRRLARWRRDRSTP